MGVNLKDLFERKEIEISSLSNKRLVFDGHNILYQFLTTIRAPDGTLLTDKKGNVTSHLIGLFSRLTNFIDKGISPIFVFDGKVPELKQKEITRRADVKKQAKKMYEKAKKEEDISAMQKYAARTAILTKQMVDEAKEFLFLLGVPVVQALSEGEAQASFIVKNGDAWGVVSQDFDSLLYGAPRLIQNLSISGRRKKAGTLTHEFVSPLLIELQYNLKRLNINQDQLIALSILVGTDYYPGGRKGIGPKNALKLVKKHDFNFDELFKEVEWDKYCSVGWKNIFEVFKKMPVAKEYNISSKAINKTGLFDFLVKEHDFNAERVSKVLSSLTKRQEQKAQKALGDY